MTNEVQAKINELHAIFEGKGYEVRYVDYDHIDRGCLFVQYSGYNARIEVKKAIQSGAPVRYLASYADYLLSQAKKEDENK